MVSGGVHCGWVRSQKGLLWKPGRLPYNPGKRGGRGDSEEGTESLESGDPAGGWMVSS